MGTKIRGVKELKVAIDGNVVEFSKDVKLTVAKYGAKLQSKTQDNMQNAYTGHYEWKKGQGRVFVGPTGATKRSVTLRKEDGGFRAVVQPHTKYFPYLEQGTRFMAKRPTLAPAFNLIQPQFTKELKNIMK